MRYLSSVRVFIPVIVFCTLLICHFSLSAPEAIRDGYTVNHYELYSKSADIIRIPVIMNHNLYYVSATEWCISGVALVKQMLFLKDYGYSTVPPVLLISSINSKYTSKSFQRENNLDIPEEVKKKLDHYLHMALQAYQQYLKRVDKGESIEKAKMKLHSELDLLASNIVIQHKNDEPILEVLIRADKNSGLEKHENIIDGVVHSTKQYDFVTGSIFLSKLMELAKFDSVLSVEASRILR